MRLGHRSLLELQIAGYQFPDLKPGCEPRDAVSLDANWLVVVAEVRVVDAQSWSFRQPALMTDEVINLVSWLREVADGAVPVAANIEELRATTVDKHPAAGWLTFTEPNLSFAVGSYEGSQVELLVGLSHESAAPPINPMRPKRSEITVVTDSQQVEDAADALQRQLAAYPVR